MSKQNAQLRRIKRTALPILKKNDVIRAGLFGSYARGDARKGSDIDLLIQFGGNKSLFDLSGLKIELEEKLKKKVDLVTYKYLYPKLRDQILKEEIRLL